MFEFTFHSIVLFLCIGWESVGVWVCGCSFFMAAVKAKLKHILFLLVLSFFLMATTALCNHTSFSDWTCWNTCSCHKWRNMTANIGLYISPIVNFAFNYSRLAILTLSANCPAFRIPNAIHHFIIDTFHILNLIHFYSGTKHTHTQKKMRCDRKIEDARDVIGTMSNNNMIEDQNVSILFVALPVAVLLDQACWHKRKRFPFIFYFSCLLLFLCCFQNYRYKNWVCRGIHERERDGMQASKVNGKKMLMLLNI